MENVNLNEVNVPSSVKWKGMAILKVESIVISSSEEDESLYMCRMEDFSVQPIGESDMLKLKAGIDVLEEIAYTEPQDSAGGE